MHSPQIVSLGFEELREPLFFIGRLARVGLHQGRIGCFRFSMKTFENFRDQIIAE